MQKVIITNTGRILDAKTNELIGFTTKPTLKERFFKWLKESGKAASFAINRLI